MVAVPVIVSSVTVPSSAVTVTSPVSASTFTPVLSPDSTVNVPVSVATSNCPDLTPIDVWPKSGVETSIKSPGSILKLTSSPALANSTSPSVRSILVTPPT